MRVFPVIRKVMSSPRVGPWPCDLSVGAALASIELRGGAGVGVSVGGSARLTQIVEPEVGVDPGFGARLVGGASAGVVSAFDARLHGGASVGVEPHIDMMTVFGGPELGASAASSSMTLRGGASAGATPSLLRLTATDVPATQDTSTDGKTLGSCVGSGNYNGSNLRVVAGAGAKYSFIGWDLSSLFGSGWTCTSASLTLRTANAGTASSLRLDGETSSFVWTDSTLVCADTPALGVNQTYSSVPNAVDTDFTITLNSTIRSSINNSFGGMFTLFLTTADTVERTYYDLENGGANGPLLSLVLEKSL